MGERARVRLRVDGRGAEAEADATVAAALANAGIDACRVSVRGEPRGPLCAMGICWECRVTIDGEPHVRACMAPVRDGMVIGTGAPPSASGLAPSASRAERLDCDVAVVGGGPAGVAAASRAAEAGARVILLDENTVPGGQIYRRRAGEAPPAAFARWIARLERSGSRVLSSSAVYDGFPEAAGGFRLFARRGAGAVDVSAGRLVLATGARERFLPFPGWTLPG